MNYFFLRSRKQQLLFIEGKTERNKVIDNIKRLRSGLTNSIPEKKLTGNLILGTWNIRELGGTKYGGRMIESLYYIAEVISRFDLIAIQEVREDLGDFNDIMKILGKDYAVYISVVTQGTSGNKERLAFIYDKRTVSFEDIAGQIVLPPGKKSVDQFARTPYVLRFQAGWIRFDIATVHIYYGKDTKSSAEYKRRVDEIKSLVDFFVKYTVDKATDIHNVFLLGDFNIEDTKSKTYEAATSSKFQIPDAILTGNFPSNLKQDKIYDQILYFSRYNNLKFSKAGVFNFQEFVFEKPESYKNRIKAHLQKELAANKFKDFTTYQMSDHLPLWVELKTDRAENYLDYLKKLDD